MTGTPYVIVGCGKSKRTIPLPAGMLYTGGYITDALRWSVSITQPERIFILSAKYGLIHIHEIIPPYNATFSGPSAEPTIARHIIAQQAHGYGLKGPIITLAGAKYYQVLREATSIEPYNPFFGWLDQRGETHQIGYQRHAMRECHGRIPKETT